MAGISLNVISGIYKHQQVQSKLRRLKRANKSFGEHEKEEKKYQIQSISASVSLDLHLSLNPIIPQIAKR
jgi:TATA-box binding protein (TBP) (component of TFIID and TFIIIB)